MAAPSISMQPLRCFRMASRHLQPAVRHPQRCARRSMATKVSANTSAEKPIPMIQQILAGPRRPGKESHKLKKIKVIPPLPNPKNTCPDPIAAITSSQLQLLDPTGARTRLFSRQNPEAAKVGDILLVRTKSGEPYSGVCLNIRRQGIDTAILLRNQLTRVGVEMWYKIYSPNVEGIEVVQRREKRARRARLYYMRQPRHDMGSVENVVRQYMRQRAAIGSQDVRGRDANSNRKKNNKKGRN